MDYQKNKEFEDLHKNLLIALSVLQQELDVEPKVEKKRKINKI